MSVVGHVRAQSQRTQSSAWPAWAARCSEVLALSVWSGLCSKLGCAWSSLSTNGMSFDWIACRSRSELLLLVLARPVIVEERVYSCLYRHPFWCIRMCVRRTWADYCTYYWEVSTGLNDVCEWDQRPSLCWHVHHKLRESSPGHTRRAVNY